MEFHNQKVIQVIEVVQVIQVVWVAQVVQVIQLVQMDQGDPDIPGGPRGNGPKRIMAKARSVTRELLSILVLLLTWNQRVYGGYSLVLLLLFLLPLLRSGKFCLH